MNEKDQEKENEKRARATKRLTQLAQFKDLTTEKISAQSEIVMAREHICNNNLKID